MKRLISIFTPALLLTAGLLLVSGAATPPVPERPVRPELVPRTVEPASPTCAVTTTEELSETARADDVVETAAPSADDELHGLLDYLDAWAKGPSGASPTYVYDEIAGIVAARPETAELLRPMFATEVSRLRTALAHTIHRIPDPALRSRLLLQWRNADPVRKRVAEVLANPSSIPRALSEMDPPTRLLQRLTEKHLESEAVRSAVRRLAESAEDGRVRGTAIYCLGRAGGEEGKDFARRILADRSRPLSDRRSAIGALGRNPDSETVEVFLSILERGDDRALVVNAAGGLGSFLGRSDVERALTDLLLAPTAVPDSRKAAARALAQGIRRTKGEVRARLEVRAEGILADLARLEGSEDIHDYALSQFTGCLGPAFRERLALQAVTFATVAGPGG